MSGRRSDAPGIGPSRPVRCPPGRTTPSDPPSRSSDPADRGPRRLREQPRDEARPAVPDGAARHRARPSPRSSTREADGRSGGTPIAAAEVAPPGLPQPAAARRRARGDVAGDPRRPAGAGAGSPPVRPRSVNVEFVSANPTGPLHVGNARGAFIGDLLSRVLEAGGQRVTREYYFNDSGGQIRNLGRVGRGAPARRAGPRGRLPRRLRRTTSRRRCPTTSGRPRPPPDADTDGDRRALGGRPRPRRASRPAWPASASASTSGRARRRSTTRAGSSARSSGCASAATSTSRTARSGSARPTSATTRTGSSSARTASRPTSRPTSAT